MCQSASSMVSNLVDEGSWDVLVEQVAHPIDEDAAGAAPGAGLGKAVRAEREVEAGFEGVAGDAAETFGEAGGVTIVAAGGDFGAAGDGVPGGVGPFDGGVVGDGGLIRTKAESCMCAGVPQ